MNPEEGYHAGKNTRLTNDSVSGNLLDPFRDQP